MSYASTHMIVLAHSMCQLIMYSVLLTYIRKGIFVAGALDDIDHNPSSTTSQSSFHGMGISILQFPTLDNPGICRQPVTLKKETTMEPQLPHSYITVLVVALNSATTTVSKKNDPSFSDTSILCRAKLREEGWLKNVGNRIGEKSLSLGLLIM